MDRTVSMPTISPDLVGGDAPRGDLFLRFDLSGGQRFAFEAAGVVEVVDLPVDQVTALPNTSPALIGTFNLRGEIIWILDLEYCLQGNLFQTTATTFPVVVIQDGEQLLGLAVRTIEGMTWQKTEDFEMPEVTTLLPALVPFVRGQLGVELLVLDAGAILRSQCWTQKFSQDTQGS